MRKCLIIGLTFSLLFGTSQVKPVSLDTETSLRIIGIAAALGGIYSIAHKTESIVNKSISTISGALLLTAGTYTVLCASRIAEEFSRHVTQDGFFNRVARGINHLGNQINNN